MGGHTPRDPDFLAHVLPPSASQLDLGSSVQCGFLSLSLRRVLYCQLWSSINTDFDALIFSFTSHKTSFFISPGSSIGKDPSNLKSFLSG